MDVTKLHDEENLLVQMQDRWENYCSLSVADVAYSLGFENPTHFSRIFKQQYGYAPSQS